MLMFNRTISLVAALLIAVGAAAAEPTSLKVSPETIHLSAGPQTWQFTMKAGHWALDTVIVNSVELARPLARTDAFWLGGGEAKAYQVTVDAPARKEIRFTLENGTATYWVDASDLIPLIHVSFEGVIKPVCAFRSIAADPHEHGGWLTRGWIATDADGSEAFVDSSNPWIFGHSTFGSTDIAYAVLADVNPHIQRNGRTEQRSGTFFKAERRAESDSGSYVIWQIRLGEHEPKSFAVVFDSNLGGRIADVCEKYFAPAVDTLVDLSALPRPDYDPEKCLQKLPVRLASPDAFIPGWGWMMDEYPKASYPFAHDAVWQTAALLTYEGLATGRDWERYFGQYVIDRTPLVGEDGKAYFARRPGGNTRWAYFATYSNPFPQLDGGNWWTADVLYQAAIVLGDQKLRQAALEMVTHDVNVKLDLEKMRFPPCWSAIHNRVGADHRDDWFQTPGLAWCAYAAAKIAYPETKDSTYLKKADRITDWFASFMADEKKLNFLQGNNMYATFSGYIPLALLERYERSRDRRFLNLARDVAWVQIMTACTTPAKDTWGNLLTGATCVGVRDCIDYDCSPNLCQEKDLNFVQFIGPLLQHAKGPGYAKYLELQYRILKKDSWNSSWVMEQRDTNLRTVYDNYARGMANLIYALNRSSDPHIRAVDQGVSRADPEISHRRDIILANGTRQDRMTTLAVRFLEPGRYSLAVDGVAQKRVWTHSELAAGQQFAVPANSLRRIIVRPAELDRPAPRELRYDDSRTYLSDLEPFDAQRGTGFPQPTFRRDRSFSDGPLGIGNVQYAKGLGCAANTVILYRLDRDYARFKATVGVDTAVASADKPKASVFFTVHVDGHPAFESGPITGQIPPKAVDVDVRGAKMLMLRMSGNWDDRGDTRNDHGDWADARLEGKVTNGQ